MKTKLQPFIDFLNKCAKEDPEAVTRLVELRVHAGFRMEKVPNILCHRARGNTDIPLVGVLEVINSVLAKDGLCIVPVSDGDRVRKFMLDMTENAYPHDGDLDVD